MKILGKKTKQAYVETLYRMLERNFGMDKITEWFAEQGIRYTTSAIKNTFKMAGREDLISTFIEEEDISIGNKVKSRATGRVGHVKGIKNDGDTILVQWETGGLQPLSKEGVYKLKDNNDFVKVHTTSKPYGDIEK